MFDTRKERRPHSSDGPLQDVERGHRPEHGSRAAVPPEEAVVTLRKAEPVRPTGQEHLPAVAEPPGRRLLRHGKNVRGLLMHLIRTHQKVQTAPPLALPVARRLHVEPCVRNVTVSVPDQACLPGVRQRTFTVLNHGCDRAVEESAERELSEQAQVVAFAVVEGVGLAIPGELCREPRGLPGLRIRKADGDSPLNAAHGELLRKIGRENLSINKTPGVDMSSERRAQEPLREGHGNNPRRGFLYSRAH